MSGELIDPHRVDPPLAAPSELELSLDDAVADVGDALALQQEVVVGEVDRPVTLVRELLHLAEHVRGRAAPPPPLPERGDVAVDAGVRAAPRGLHRAELVEGEDRRDVERQRLDVVDGQALPVRVRELVEIPDQRPRDVPDDLAPPAPGEPGDRLRGLEVGEVVEQELLPLPDPDVIDLRAVREDPLGVDGREGAARDDRDPGVRLLDDPRQRLRGRVGGHREEGERDDVGALLPRRLGDVLRLHPRVAGVEHPDAVSGPPQHRGERLDPEGREGHHADPAVGRRARRLREQAVVGLVADVHQKDVHETSYAIERSAARRRQTRPPDPVGAPRAPPGRRSRGHPHRSAPG